METGKKAPPLQWLLSREGLVGVALAILLFASVWPISQALNPGPDWHTFYEASHYLVSGQSPYKQPAFANPPWALLPALPLALLLPEQVGRGAWFVLSVVAFAVVAYRLGAKPLSLALFLAGPMTAHNLLNGNIDWLPFLGFTLPPVWGLPLVLIKPQIGIGIALYWLVQAYRQGGWRRAIVLLAPTLAAYGLSFAVYGLWPLTMGTVFRNSIQWNASFWPYTIPLGILLIGVAISRSDPRWVYPVGPMLSPYALFHTWNGVLLALLDRPRLMAAIVVPLWIMVFARI